MGYLLEKGVHQTSLRPLANQLGTSTYTFVYHFGSKDDLLAEALEEISSRHAIALESMRSGSVDQFIRSYWAWNVSTDRLRTVKVITDARSLVRTQGALYRPFVRSVTGAVQSVIGGRLEAEARSADESIVITTALFGTLTDLATEESVDADVDTIDQLVNSVA